MGMYDYLTLAAAHVNDDWAKMLAGTYSVSFGDNLSAMIGSGRQTHIVGDEIKYVLDWAGCLNKLLSGVPLLGAALNSAGAGVLFGDGGNMTWTFGRKTDLHYFGPAITIKRAGDIAVTSYKTGFFSDAAVDLLKETVEEFQLKENVDANTGILAGTLSMVMLIINTGVEIAARVNYQAGYQNKNNKFSDAVNKQCTEDMTRYCTASLMLTTRVMYIVKCIEMVNAASQNNIKSFFQAKEQSKLSLLASVCASNSKPRRDDLKDRLERAATAISEFMLGLVKVLAALVLIALALGVLAGVALGAAYGLNAIVNH